MGLLDAIYSNSDSLKRRLRGLLADPMGTVQQSLSMLSEDAKDAGKTNKRIIENPETLTAKDTSGLLGSATSFAPFGMTVWHGSPHKFSKFDMSKIGTGEGAQAYGHGLYMAEHPAVATEYRDKLSRDVAYRGRPVAEQHPMDSRASSAIHSVSSRVANGEDAASAIRNEIQSYIDQANFYRQHIKEVPEAAQEVKMFEEIAAELKKLDPASFKKNEGALYKVDIPDEAVARFLDWDKPVAEELRKPVSEAAMKQWESGLSGTSGEHLYNEVVKNFEWAGSKSPKDDAIKWLNQQGIPGIRYLDGGSRSAGQGSSNFVLFDDQLPRILETNGVPTGQVPWKPGEWGLLGR